MSQGGADALHIRLAVVVRFDLDDTTTVILDVEAVLGEVGHKHDDFVPWVEQCLESDIDRACRAAAKLAHAHYREANAVMARHPAGRLTAPRLMSAVYSSILAKMESNGWAPPRERAKIGKIALLWIVLSRGLMG